MSYLITHLVVPAVEIYAQVTLVERSQLKIISI